MTRYAISACAALLALGLPLSAAAQPAAAALDELRLLVRQGERIVRRFRVLRCVEYRPP